jgi:hypothetical protein
MRKTAVERVVLALLFDGHPPEETVQYLKDYELDDLGVTDIERTRDSIRLARESWHPRNPSHEPSQQFMKTAGIETWFAKDSDLAAARRLLQHSRAREAAEALLVLDAPFGWVRGAVARYGITLTDRAAQVYGKFFFDVRDMDDAAVAAMLSRRVAAGWQSSNDGRHVALRSRGSPVGLAAAAMRLGRMPAGIDIARIARATRNAAGMAALEAVLADRPRKAERFASVLRSAQEVLEAVGDVEGEMQNQLAAVLETEAEQVRHISELGGEHTTSLDVPAPSADDCAGTSTP